MMVFSRWRSLGRCRSAARLRTIEPSFPRPFTASLPTCTTSALGSSPQRCFLFLAIASLDRHPVILRYELGEPSLSDETDLLDAFTLSTSRERATRDRSLLTLSDR